MRCCVVSALCTHGCSPRLAGRYRSGGFAVTADLRKVASACGPIRDCSKAFALAFSEALWAETRGSEVRILALCPGPVATGYFASLGDQAASSSIIYRRTADPADIVKAGLRGFDRGAMTVVPRPAHPLACPRPPVPPADGHGPDDRQDARPSPRAHHDRPPSTQPHHPHLTHGRNRLLNPRVRAGQPIRGAPSRLAGSAAGRWLADGSRGRCPHT